MHILYVVYFFKNKIIYNIYMLYIVYYIYKIMLTYYQYKKVI